MRDLRPAGDEEWLLPCVEGPRVAAAREPIAAVYHQHAPRMRLIAVRDFRVPLGDADSIVRDIFTRYFTNPGAVRGELEAYFRGAVRNACAEYWRRVSP